ncbi:hypothetical protein U9M48_000511 [Paspalum notatum var. saurae]|uniref:Uncharacterized protein n=1 Tax=Paspalum notatum var. saurae TaxID=547442 RepID=A0AAQ3PGX0_PASNO
MYEPGDDEYREGEIEKDIENFTANRNVSTNTRASKRVMATSQSARITRQRTTEPSPTEEDCNDQSSAMIDRWSRGRSVGRDLDRITKGLNSKIPMVVSEGKKRPDAPMQAAKLASESGIILRQHVPIFPHWKEYKKESAKEIVENYMIKVAAKFTMDRKDKAVKEALIDLLRSGVRQMRYKLKKAYFDGVPANQVRKTSPLKSTTDEQWQALVNLWSGPKHKDNCTQSRSSRGKVQFPQKTGSRSYVAQVHVLKQEKFKDAVPTAIDLFKACHCSSKTGFTVPVREAIATMEAIVAEPAVEGQEPKTPSEAVAQVLSSSKFLQNVGLEPTATKRNGKAIVAARIQDLEDELEAEKLGAAAVRDELEALKKKVSESEEVRSKESQEIENLRKEAQENNILLRRLLSLNKE